MEGDAICGGVKKQHDGNIVKYHEFIEQVTQGASRKRLDYKVDLYEGQLSSIDAILRPVMAINRPEKGMCCGACCCYNEKLELISECEAICQASGDTTTHYLITLTPIAEPWKLKCWCGNVEKHIAHDEDSAAFDHRFNVDGPKSSDDTGLDNA